MRRILALLLGTLMAAGLLAGCGQNNTSSGGNSSVAPPEKDVEMQYISVEDATQVLDDGGYLFLDVRKAADYATSHIPGAVGVDMDAAKNGDFNAGVSAMQSVAQNSDKNLVIICYSGKTYAQATTNVLSALGYDMSKVYTLEGGFTAWTETYPDQVTAG